MGPITVTRDHKEFQERLQEIDVLGGADCPENTLRALLKAIQISEPGSYIYVFTDASANDYELYNKVSTLIQSKQSQVMILSFPGVILSQDFFVSVDITYMRQNKYLQICEIHEFLSSLYPNNCRG